jgi:hypothetical protein
VHAREKRTEHERKLPTCSRVTWDAGARGGGVQTWASGRGWVSSGHPDIGVRPSASSARLGLGSATHSCFAFTFMALGCDAHLFH